VIVEVYATPTVPFASVLVSASVAGEITIVSTWPTFCAGGPLSVTFTVTIELPATVGVPLTTQPVSESPVGSDPEIEQLYGVVPPVAVIVELYATPTCPFGKVFVMLSAVGAITIVSFALTLCAGVLASITFTVTVELPAVVGVPLTAHPVRLRPEGKVPPAIEQA
jgi:hypothetical protein